MLCIDTKPALREQRCPSPCARLSDRLSAGSTVCAAVNEEVNFQPRGNPIVFGVTPSQIAGVTPRKSGVTPGSNMHKSFRFQDLVREHVLVQSRLPAEDYYLVN